MQISIDEVRNLKWQKSRQVSDEYIPVSDTTEGYTAYPTLLLTYLASHPANDTVFSISAEMEVYVSTIPGDEMMYSTRLKSGVCIYRKGDHARLFEVVSEQGHIMPVSDVIASADSHWQLIRNQEKEVLAQGLLQFVQRGKR